MGKPYWKEGWATSWCRKMIQCLEDRHEYYLAVNDAVAEKIGVVDKVNIIVFSQQELLEVFPEGYLQASSAWYFHNYSKKQIKYYISLMKEKLQEDNFDVVITFTQVPFLEQLYPSARILHMEFSIFSRMPFPMTWYLDPCGLYENNYLNKFKNQIHDIELDDNQKTLVRNLRNTCEEVLLDNNIFEDEIKRLRSKYNYILLLPVQFSGYYGFDCLSVYKNQFDYLTRCLENIPEEIGVIFTMHPEYPIFDEETVSYITSRYRNAIFIEKSREVYAASQFLMPLIDGVITVSSSIGIQTLLFGKKLIAIGNDNFDYIADGHELGNELIHTMRKATKDKSNILWFIITKYAISDDYLFDGEWLDSFLKRCINKDRLVSFYEDVDTPEIVFRKHIKNINNNKFLIPQWVSKKMLRDNKFLPYMYYSIEEEWDEKYKIGPEDIVAKDDYYTRFDLSDVKADAILRFDPIEGQYVCLELLSVKSDAVGVDVLNTNATYHEKNTYYFLTDDPNIFFKGNFSIATYIGLEYKTKRMDNEMIKFVIEKITSEAIKEVNDLKMKIDDYNSRINRLENEIEEKNKKMKEINSLSICRWLNNIGKLFK